MIWEGWIIIWQRHGACHETRQQRRHRCPDVLRARKARSVRCAAKAYMQAARLNEVPP